MDEEAAGRKSVMAGDLDYINVLPRPMTLGCALTGIAHLRHRDIMLHVALDEKQTWKVTLLPEDAEADDASIRKALIDLPYQIDGTHYVAVTAYLPNYERATAKLSFDGAAGLGVYRDETKKDWLVLAIVGIKFSISQWERKDAINQQITNVVELQNSNSACSTKYGNGDDAAGATYASAAARSAYAAPCAVCRMTIHAAGFICLRADEEAALEIQKTLMPSYLANKLRLESPSGWVRNA